MNDYGLTQAEVAERVGKSRSAVANSVRLLSPAGGGAASHSRGAHLGRPRAGAARPAGRQDNAGAAGRDRAAAVVGAPGRSLGQAVAGKPSSSRPRQPKRTPDPQLVAHMTHLENRFRSALGTKVNLNRNEDGSGRLVVHFYSDDDLEAIYRLIAGYGRRPGRNAPGRNAWDGTPIDGHEGLGAVGQSSRLVYAQRRCPFGGLFGGRRQQYCGAADAGGHSRAAAPAGHT